MTAPDLSSNKRPRLTVVSDTLAQSGVLVLRHLLDLSSKRVFYAIENDPELYLAGQLHTVELVDCWSCTAFDDSTPQSLERRQWIPAERITGLEYNLRDKDVFIDSLDALVAATSESRALRILRVILDRCAHLSLMIHADAAHPCLWAPTPYVSGSLLHLAVHPRTIIPHLVRAYGVVPGSPQSYDLLHRLHLRSWGGAGFVYGDSSTTVEEFGTVLNALSDPKQPEAYVSWSRRSSGGSKLTRGICRVRWDQRRLLWEDLDTQAPAAAPAAPELTFDHARTSEQQKDRDNIALPFSAGGPAVVYEADSGDDFDEDEPDDELEI